MNNNFQRYQAEYVLRDYFKDRDTFNFKYGLEFGLNSNLSSASDNSLFNLDEDPTIFGFDMVILDNSALFNDVDDFINFGNQNGISDIIHREETYETFIKHFSKFFNVDDKNRGNFKTDSRFNSFKTHYLNGVAGLDKLAHHIGVGYETGKRQMVDYGKDKLTFSLNEDVPINSGFLSAAYRNFVYSKKNGRMVIPENLLRFDAVIIISEIRKFNRVSNLVAQALSGDTNIIPVFNDNISRYIFTLYDCQLNFNKYSFTDAVKQAGYNTAMDISSGFDFDMYYRYVGMEMEKFDFHPDKNNDQIYYLNDQRDNINSYQLNTDANSTINQQTPALVSDNLPNRPFDKMYKMYQMNKMYNSTEGKKYQFDFPMVKSNYVKSEIDLRNTNAAIADTQGSFRVGLNNIIQRTNEQLQTKFIQGRSQLISDLAAKIREQTGLINISSPTNVYSSSTLMDFALGKVGDFANLAVGTALSKGSSFLNTKLSAGIEKTAFDIANATETKLKGFRGSNNTPSTTGGDIPNVYR